MRCAERICVMVWCFLWGVSRSKFVVGLFLLTVVYEFVVESVGGVHVVLEGER